MSATMYLPAARVRVVRNGRLYPWAPPPPGPPVPCADTWDDPLVQDTIRPRPAKAATTPKGGRPATAMFSPVICTDRQGQSTRYPSILAAAEATRMATKAIYHQCLHNKFRSKGGARRARFAFRFA